jgi:transcriptional regulator with XRE-family HTH domain
MSEKFDFSKLPLKGITQKDLSVLLGVSRTTVNHWLTGKHPPSEQCILRLRDVAAVLNQWQRSYRLWFMSPKEKNALIKEAAISLRKARDAN